ncbi:hypothetical protein GGR51DRAFT_571830 [Nemania sp. FL0031]|nr:hypothetical protein GGR51DRAFT_571830 [Nemania sp. FL0031]
MLEQDWIALQQMWQDSWHAAGEYGYIAVRTKELTTDLARLAKDRPPEKCAEDLVELLLDLMIKVLKKNTAPIMQEQYDEKFPKSPLNYGLDYDDPLNILSQDESPGGSHLVYLHQSCIWQIPMLWNRRDNMPQLSKLLPLVPDILVKMFKEYRTAMHLEESRIGLAAETLLTFPISFQMAVVARLRLRLPDFRHLPPELSKYTLRTGWGEPWRLIHIGVVNIVDSQIQVVTMPFDIDHPDAVNILFEIWQYIHGMYDGEWEHQELAETWTIPLSRDSSVSNHPEASGDHPEAGEDRPRFIKEREKRLEKVP